MLANYGSHRYIEKEERMAKLAMPKRVLIYRKPNGDEPFTQWLYGIKDKTTRQRILIRLRGLEHGNCGDYHLVSEGVSELRMFFGPGYRVYFGEDAGHIVVLLCGGDKKSQQKDIKQAKVYWEEYLSNEKP